MKQTTICETKFFLSFLWANVSTPGHASAVLTSSAGKRWKPRQYYAHHANFHKANRNLNASWLKKCNFTITVNIFLLFFCYILWQKISLWLAVCVKTLLVDRDLFEIYHDLIHIGRDIIATHHITENWSRSSWNTSRCNYNQWHPEKLVTVRSNTSRRIASQPYPK